uniref:FAM234A/B beta-propeller domain-containing protein n=1 Tax=Magallana gigas TaxID=29159 RepID=A0A8W8L8K2_MAGGI
MAHTFKLEPTDDDYCSEKKDEFKKNQTTPPIIPGTEIPSKEKRIPTKINLKQRKFKVNTLGCITYIIVTTISIVIVGYLIIKHQLTNQLQSNLNAKTPKIKGCDHIEVEDVWATTLPKLLTESAFRLSDVNKDGIPDFIFGFATGVDGYSIPKIVCDIYFNGTFPCYGGMMALNGEDGKELWRYYTDHEIFGINCNADLNSDGVNDCLGGGRAGVFDAVNGRTGTLLWKFKDKLVKNSIMNLYTAHIIDDLDKDGILDVLAIHGGDPLSEPGLLVFRLISMCDTYMDTFYPFYSCD